MWVKYKHTFAWGKDKEWKYIETEEQDFIENCGYSDVGEFLMVETGIARDYEYSDKYRGIEYHIVPYPPYNVLKTIIDKYKNYIEHYKEEIERHQRLLEEMGEIKQGDFKV